MRRDAVRTASDRGSATVWSVGAVAVLCLVFGVVLALGQAVVARHRAAGGADLAALAAADRWAGGGAAACDRAERVARAQGVRLVRCALTGQVSDVTAASGTGPFTAEVRARAGPASATPPAPIVPLAPPGREAPPVPSAPPSPFAPPTPPPPPPAAAP
ncbi:Rv3654c family TadE-like protein [Streptomyces salinarius]|uniref:Rv3654c family TadE-like protein n=1 Tax=Streptomyces salinarius TaxID=2762598 RepID=UPI0013DCBB19|nr:Rv3654c family TadE-like protein [Streptomyces salinarius]